MIAFLSFLLATSTLISAETEELNCRCSVVIVGDNQIYVNYESTTMAHAHDCEDSDGCVTKCEEMMKNASYNGDLNAKPAELHGASIGDYGCRLIGLDINKGVTSVYARVCNKASVKTNFKFKNDLCCRGRVYYENCGESTAQ